MRFLTYLGKSVTLLNLVLVVAIALGTIGLVAPLSKLKVKFTLPVTKMKPAVEADKGVDAGHSPSPSDFVVIAEQNLFHPDRKVPTDKKNDLPKPELILYGTLVTDSLSVAYIEDKKAPVTTAGRGKRQTASKKGDVISGFTITEISSDKIVLVRGDERMTVPLMEGEKRKGMDQPPAKTQPAQPSVGQPAVRPSTPPGSPVRIPTPQTTVGSQPGAPPIRPGTSAPMVTPRLRGQSLPAGTQQ
jgi:hypothetical protein